MFANAEKVHEMGGNSKSYAELVLTTPLGRDLKMGTNITGINNKNKKVVGKALQNYPAGSQKIGFQYPIQNHHVRYLICKVGALLAADQTTRGCTYHLVIVLRSDSQIAHILGCSLYQVFRKQDSFQSTDSQTHSLTSRVSTRTPGPSRTSALGLILLFDQGTT